MNQKAWMITGASRGLGAEIAKAVLAAGDQLIATARDAQALASRQPRKCDRSHHGCDERGASEICWEDPGLCGGAKPSAGDPVKLAAAIVQLANADDPPLRLPLGGDALERIVEKNRFERRAGANADCRWREDIGLPGGIAERWADRRLLPPGRVAAVVIKR